MILPTKHLAADAALLSVGARVLRHLRGDMSVSRLWEEVRRAARNEGTLLPFDWFILALDLLFILGAVELRDERVRRMTR